MTDTTTAIETGAGATSIPWGMTSRYHFVTYIVDDDPGDVTTGVADRVPLNRVLDELAAYNGMQLTEPRWYDLRYRRGALVDAEPASPELAALEMEITRGVMDAMLKTDRILPDITFSARLAGAIHHAPPPSVESRCDVCGRGSLLAESVGERCGWTDDHTIKPCIGRMTAVIR